MSESAPKTAPEIDVEPRPIEPIENSGHEAGSALARPAKQPHPRDPRRWSDGTMRPGNSGLARRHGGRARQPLASPESSDLYRGYVSDLGGDLTAGEAVVLRRLAEADAVCRQAFRYLQNSRESWTSRRALNALQVLSVHSQTVLKASGVLGIKRRTRHVDPVSAVRAAVEAANRKAGGK